MTTILPTIAQPTTARSLGELLGMHTPMHTTTKKGKRSRGEEVEEEPIVFPLVKVHVRTNILGDCAVTQLEEHYANTHAQPMDVTHTIPLPCDGAVTAFEIVAGARSVKGVCKKKEQARADFESARSRGRTAGLVESARDDVHTIQLTNIPPKTEIVVRMTIVERLRVDDGRFEFRFPTTISEKYVPGDPFDHSGEGTSPDTLRAPDASLLTPPIRLSGGTALDLEITLAAGATDISSSLALARSDDADGTIRLRPAASPTCNGDIVLRSWARGSNALVRAYSDGERTLVLVDPPAQRKPELEAPREAVFVLDRSGSMANTRITAAKRALTRALQSLAERDSFEIIAFDTVIERFNKELVPATSRNISAAIKWLEGIDARGGTEALEPLSLACAHRVRAGSVRTVLFLTDGDVGNDGEIIELTRRIDPATRLFAIGIGMAPSEGFISRLARLGGGTHLCLQDKEDIEREITRFEAAFAGPMACGLREVDSRHSSHSDLFAGRSASFFLDGARQSVKITSTDGRFNGECVVQKAPVPLGALWARDRVKTLEDRLIAHPQDRELIEPEITMLGVNNQIQTRFTSFVAVDEASEVHGEALSFVQPVDRVADRDVYACRSSLPPMARCAPRVSHRAPLDDVDDSEISYCMDLGASIAPQVSSGRASRAFSAQTRLPRESDETTIKRYAAAVLAGRNPETDGIGHEPTLDELLKLALVCVATGVDANARLMQEVLAALSKHQAAGTTSPALARFIAILQRGMLSRLGSIACMTARVSTLDELFRR